MPEEFRRRFQATHDCSAELEDHADGDNDSIRIVRHSPPPAVVPLAVNADAPPPNNVQPQIEVPEAPPQLVAQAEVQLPRAPARAVKSPDNEDGADSIFSHETLSMQGDQDEIAAEEADIRARIAALRRQRRELLDLQREVADLAANNATAAVAVAEPRREDAAHPVVDNRPVDNNQSRPPAPHTLVKSITPFSGDDVTEDIAEFFRDLEMIFDLYETDAAYKTLAVRYAVTGTAKIFVSTLDVRTYDAVKAELMREFGRAMTPADAERLLQQRRWQRREGKGKGAIE